jgi:uncharacterized membrane protein HdeD (DUF308 family)
MYNAGPESMPTQGWYAEGMLLSKLLVAAGLCAIAAALWKSSKGTPWLLLLYGLALSAYGLIPILLTRTPLSFRLFAALVVVIAISFGFLVLTIARIFRRQHHTVDAWLSGLAGAASVGVAFAFLALANRWIQLERALFHPSLFLWFCLFFAFNAICMLGLALRLRRFGPSHSDPGTLLPLRNPSHAH